MILASSRLVGMGDQERIVELRERVSAAKQHLAKAQELVVELGVDRELPRCLLEAVNWLEAFERGL